MTRNALNYTNINITVAGIHVNCFQRSETVQRHTFLGILCNHQQTIQFILNALQIRHRINIMLQTKTHPISEHPK